MSTLISNTIKPTSGDTVTFTDNVSIGGTLTYEDVTNVDSVGIVTARTGIKVAAGQSISPESGTIAYYGDGSNLTGIEPGVENFVASGTIDNGTPVIINTDGTVGIVTMVTSNTSSAGISSVYHSTSAAGNASSSTSTNNKVVIAYKDADNSNHGTARVGTVTGTGITFGPASVFHSAGVNYTSSIYDSANDRVVISYGEGASVTGSVKVGTVTGDTISFPGPAAVYSSAQVNGDASSVYANGKVVFVYNVSSGGKAIVGTVNPSNNSISFGSTAVFSPVASDIASTYDSTNDRVVISYRNVNNNSYIEAIVGEVDTINNTIGFGNTVVAEYSNSEYSSATYDSTSNRVVISYRKSTPDNGKSIVGTVDPNTNSISFGTSNAFESVAGAVQITSAYDTNANRVVIAYRYNGSPWNGRAIAGTVDPNDNSIGFGNTVTFYSPTSDIYYPSATYDSTSEKVVIFYTKGSIPQDGRASVFSATGQTTNLTSENYIGISGEAISNGATGKINITGGVNSGQSGLTTAKKYYVGQTGILTTTADTPSVVAGTSISDTEILVWS
jgi:hypothetical protein